MNILVTICGRAGSKGVKSKNVRLIGGIPLVNFTLEKYEHFKENVKDEVTLAINTDSAELLAQVSQYGITHEIVEREENLAGDKVGKIAVIQDTLQKVETRLNKTFDVVIDLDLTSPLRENGDIEGVFTKLCDDETLDVVFSVVPSRRSPWFNMVKENPDGSCGLVIESNYLTRQEAPVCYDMNASIYAYKRSFLLNPATNRVLDGKASYFIMKDYGVLDIDNEEDFLEIERLLTIEK